MKLVKLLCSDKRRMAKGTFPVGLNRDRAGALTFSPRPPMWIAAWAGGVYRAGGETAKDGGAHAGGQVFGAAITSTALGMPGM